MVQTVRVHSLYKKLLIVSVAFILAVSTLTASVPFILSQKAGALSDAEKPKVSLQDISNFVSETVTVVGSVSDDTQLSHYNLSLYSGDTDLSNGQPKSEERIVTPDGEWTKNGTVYNPSNPVEVKRSLNTRQLIDGALYQIRLAAKDVAGNVEVKVASFIVDNTPPNTTLTFEGDKSSAQSANARLKVEEPLIEAPSGGWEPLDGTNTIFVKTYKQNVREVVKVEDRAGNTSTVDIDIDWIDTTPPIILGIVNNSIVRGVVSFSVDDPAATVRVNGIITASRQLAGDGEYVIVAEDEAGNRSTSVRVVINNAQNITVIPPDPESAIPLISGTARWVTNPGPVDSLSVTLDGEIYGATIDSDGNWSFRVTKPLKDGRHILLVNGAQFEFTTSLPKTFVTPIITGPASVLGVSTAVNDADDEAIESIQGTSSHNIFAQAVDSDANEGRFMGLAWYWWLLILAGVSGIAWWVVGSLRKNNS